MKALQVYNQDMAVQPQPRQQTLDPRIMHNLYTSTAFFMNGIRQASNEVLYYTVEEEEVYIFIMLIGKIYLMHFQNLKL